MPVPKKAAKQAAKKAARRGKRTPRGLPDPQQVPRPWLAGYPPGVPERYEYPLVPLTRLLDDAAKDFPHSAAVEFLGYTLTYRQLLDQVDRFATALQHLGVRKGTRVGLVLPNCPQHVVAIFATLRLGAVVVECNPAHTSAELEAQLNDTGCRVVVCIDPVYPKLAALKGRLSTVEHVVGTSVADALPVLKSWLFPVRHRNDPEAHYRIPVTEGVLRFTELVNRTAPAVVQTDIDARNDLAFVLYTGGTSGESKGVMLSHFNLVANAFQGRLWLPDVQAGRENVLCVVPLHHAYGLTACLMIGVLSAATLTLLPSFDLKRTLSTVDKRKPTLLPAGPAIYTAITEAPDVVKHDLSSIRVGLSDAAVLPVEVARRFEELTGGKLREGSGLTEAAPITHVNPVYGKAKRGSIGLPVTDTVCVLVDLDDATEPAPPGGPGELAISGPQVMVGYWNRPEETAAVLREGWLLTGAVVTVDEQGYFAIVERKKGAAGGQQR
jgi:long-chain acyl-CoA synthetase